MPREQVLLVDDEPQMLVALDDLLSDRFDVLTANSGGQALALLERERAVAVVITDQRMPEMTGDELLARIGSSSDAARILLTGFADVQAVMRAVNEGQLFAYLSKPWRPEDLLARVERAAELVRGHRALAREHRLLEERATMLEERHALEKRLHQAQKMEAIGQLAGGLAHDFNNFLAVIETCGDLVRDVIAPGAPGRDEIEQLLTAARQASSLTKQLLALGRRDAGRYERLDIGVVAVRAERMVRHLIGPDVRLVLTVTPSLGRVRADEGQLQQVILNLAINGRDAMPEGGTLTIEAFEATISATSRPEQAPDVPPGRYVTLAVADTGTGMDAETRRRMFEPFFTTKAPGKGTGLGLSMVYGIVERSGGHVTVSSEPGRGTRFVVYLPRDDTASDPAVAPASAR